MTAVTVKPNTWPVSMIVWKQDCHFSNIPAILPRFCACKFGISSDIEKAFLHVQLHQKDRDFTCFFWPRCPCDPKSKLQAYRFRVVWFGSASSPFMLYVALHSHLTQCTFSIYVQGSSPESLCRQHIVRV